MGGRGWRARGMRASLLALFVLLGALGVGASAQATPLSWSGPLSIDHHPPFAYPAGFTSISCPDSGHCAAAFGPIDVATNPTGDYTAWHQVTGRAVASAIACPATSLCVGGGRGFSISTAPFAGGPWTQIGVDATNFIDSISCPSTSFCAAVDQAGNALTSTTPTVASSWHIAPIDPGGVLLSVSCPSAGFCAAVDAAGNALTSTHPTGGAGAWSTRLVDSQGLEAISCPSSGLCVAAGNNDGQIATATNPTGGASAWTLASPGSFNDPAGGIGLDCPSTSLCVLVAGTAVVTTTTPAAGAGTWRIGGLAAEQGAMQAVSCPTANFCAAADTIGGGPGFPTAFSGGDILTTSAPTTNAWAIQQVDGTNNPVSVSCSDPTYCIVGDNGGNVLTSANPGGGASAWRFDHVDTDGANGGPGSAGPATLTAVACHSSRGCVAGDNAGDIMSTTNPLGGASTWNLFTGVAQYYNTFPSAACPTASECLIDDAFQNLAVVNPASTTAPALTPIGWAMAGLSCPSTSLCVGVSGHDAVISTSPTGGASAWKGTSIDSHTLTGVSCPSATLCVAVDNAGNALWTSTPITGGWHTVDIDGPTQLNGIACASASLCVAVDNTGRALSSTTPMGSASSWSSTTVDSYGLAAVSCSSAPVCVIVNGDGVFVGTAAAGGGPSATTGPARNVTANRAVLTGTVNPGGATVTSCHFEYGASTHFTASVPCEHAVGGGSSPVSVSATVRGLTRGTRYVFRLVIATSAGHVSGGDQSFTTARAGGARRLAREARAARQSRAARRSRGGHTR